MELDPFDGVSEVPHAHDFAILRCGAHLEVRGQARPLDREGMIAAAHERIWEPLEDRPAVVGDPAHLSVEETRRVAHPAAESRPNALVPEAHSQGRGARADVAQQIRANPEITSLRGMAWAWGQDDRVRRDAADVLEGDRVVPIHHRVGSEFPETLVEVVHEGVVVVDDQDLHGVPSERAAFRPRSLCSVSIHSRSGLESATIPAPAWR